MADPVVSTDRGALRGVKTPNGYAFWGVPYAKAPFGPRRFRPPEVTERWEGERPAQRPAPTAPQPAPGFTIIPEPRIDGGEAPACLSLNVFTPELGPAAGLGVLVWIHGGGFVSGTPSSPWYNGDRFARDGVVVVSVGYRLGAEGFLNIPGAPPNRGVLDWICALEWVQRNIAAFGGDPAKVTVGGQSAGGLAAMLLATLPRGTGLMRALIAMSGSVFPARSADRALELTERIARHLGIEATLGAFERVPPGALVEAQVAAMSGRGVSLAERVGRELPLFPVVDGDVVRVSPDAAVAGGAGSQLALLIGTTAEEFNPSVGMVQLDEAMATEALERLGLDAAGRAWYRSLGRSPADWVGQAVTDRSFKIPALRVAEARTTAPAPTFHYEFQWRSPALNGIGAVHCLDLPFVFDVLDDDHVNVVAGEAPPQELADRMHIAWVNFVTGGDPSWPAFTAARRATMVFDETCMVREDLHEPIRSLWP